MRRALAIALFAIGMLLSQSARANGAPLVAMGATPSSSRRAEMAVRASAERPFAGATRSSRSTRMFSKPALIAGICLVPAGLSAIALQYAWRCTGNDCGVYADPPILYLLGGATAVTGLFMIAIGATQVPDEPPAYAVTFGIGGAGVRGRF